MNQILEGVTKGQKGHMRTIDRFLDTPLKGSQRAHQVAGDSVSKRAINLPNVPSHEIDRVKPGEGKTRKDKKEKNGKKAIK